MNSHEIANLQQALVQAWNIKPVREETASEEEILRRLAERVQSLLRHDFHKLLTSMYLLDVPEDRFNAALKAPVESEQAEGIARIILEREIEKMRIRQEYARRKKYTSENQIESDET